MTTITTLGENLRLKILKFGAVQNAINEAYALLKDTDKFNTHAHSHESISSVIPDDVVCRHVTPSQAPSMYRNWVSLLMSEQKNTQWHTFELPRFLIEDILIEHTAWSLQGKVNEERFDDLVEQFPTQTIKGVDATAVLNGTEWFLRLDNCSAKDAENSTLPVQSVADQPPMFFKASHNGFERCPSRISNREAQIILGPI